MTQRFKRILVPLDGSKLAESVLPITLRMAQCLQARIMLLHIIEERPPQTVHGEPHLTTATEAKAYLDGVEQRYAEHLSIEQHVHSTGERSVASSIAAHVQELEADMVALCTHGRGGLRRVVSGSIAQQVLKHVSVPILLAGPGTQDTGSLKTLLVPLDGTPDGEAALPTAIEISKSCQAAINLTRVVPTLETVTGDLRAASSLIPISTAATLDAEQEESRRYLGSILDKLRSQNIPANAEVRRGEIIAALAEAASDTPTDLIVIATHGRAGLDAVWTGSVTANLIGRVTQPILMVKIGA